MLHKLTHEKVMPSTHQNHSILTGGPELLDRVASLWLALRAHHAALAPQWAPTLHHSFEDRRAGLIAKAAGGMLIVLASANGKDIAYCLSTIFANREGEIDSFYVSDNFRSQGIGKLLLDKTMHWFADQSVNSITVDVLAGNAAAQKFYQQHGFALRTARLRYIGNAASK